MHDLEISELLEVPEFKISDASNSLPDCFIEGDDSSVDGGVGDGEQVDNVFPITCEFRQSVREGEDSRSNSPIPGDGPVSAVFDQLGGFDHSEGDFKVTKLLDLWIVMGGGELATEDCIKIDSSSCNDVLPLRIRELGTVGFINK